MRESPFSDGNYNLCRHEFLCIFVYVWFDVCILFFLTFCRHLSLISWVDVYSLKKNMRLSRRLFIENEHEIKKEVEQINHLENGYIQACFVWIYIQIVAGFIGRTGHLGVGWCCCSGFHVQLVAGVTNRTLTLIVVLSTVPTLATLATKYFYIHGIAIVNRRIIKIIIT